MSLFALRIPPDARVKSWLKVVCKRLRGHDIARIPFGHDMKFLNDELVLFDIAPLFPRPFGWFVLIPCTVIAFAAAAYGYNLGWVFWIGGIFFTVWELFWTPLLYIVLVWVQVRRITGRWQRIRLANKEALRWMLYGKI